MFSPTPFLQAVVNVMVDAKAAVKDVKGLAQMAVDKIVARVVILRVLAHVQGDVVKIVKETAWGTAWADAKYLVKEVVKNRV